VTIRDVEHQLVDIDATREHTYNQVSVRRLRSSACGPARVRSQWPGGRRNLPT
jgi:hypothetical protein